MEMRESKEIANQFEKHIERYIGPIQGVFRQTQPSEIPIDLYCVAPTLDRNFYTFITSGMSRFPMNVPTELSRYRFAELMLCLPPEWELNSQDPNDSWPIDWLKRLARIPHEQQTFLLPGTTIPNGMPARPFAENTELCCALISFPETIDDEQFFYLPMNEEEGIYFFTFVPIYQEEFEIKQKFGARELLNRLGDYLVDELLDVERVNVGLLK
jgi:hypothetical protein